MGILIDLGSKKETKDRQCRTPLWHAAWNGHKAVVELLLEKGANIESADDDGFTPLAVAVDRGNRDLAKFLLEKGARMRPESNTNCSPLCIAALNGEEGIVELLVDYRADLNHFSDNRETPISMAARRGHSMVVKVLIDMGADINLKDDDGRTAMSYAKENNQESVVKLLSQEATLRQLNERAIKKGEEEGLVRRTMYQYPPLLEDGHIRILELQPGKAGDIINFELHGVDLKKNPSFEALSYEWKEKSGTIPVQCNQERLLVTPNCKAALEQLRHETDKRSLWMDAVCINQQDKQECNQQVAMMTDIYRKAKTVLMWIGKEGHFTEAAFRSFPALSKLHEALLKDPDGSSLDHFTLEDRSELRELGKDVFGNVDITAGVRELLSRPYFTRAWIFQEIILAGSRGLVMCGGVSLSLEDVQVGALGLRRLRKCP